MKKSAASYLFPLLLITVQADDWPKLLGPTGDNVSKEIGLIDAFPKGGPKQVFSRRIGTGYAAPSIRDGKIVVFHRASKLHRIEENDTLGGVIKYVNGELAALKAKERLTEASLKAALQTTRRRGYIELPEAIAKHLPRSPLMVLISGNQPTFEVSIEATQSGGGNHSFRRCSYTHQHVNLTGGVGGVERG